MNPRRLLLSDTLAGLPLEWPRDPLPAIRSALRAARKRVAVLDDDPTGMQTVHGVAVLTDWSAEAIADELARELAAFYILTNTRGMTLDRARALNAEAGRNLAEAARRVHREYVVVSRSDSTLRGHFPGEVDALADALGGGFDAWLLVPFFLEGGRYTINDVHYVAEGDWLMPAGDTEFARDPAFAYRSSNLRQWVAEKTAGRIPAESVASISLEEIRVDGPERVAERLKALRGGKVCVVNAASMRDLEVFVLGLLDAEEEGRRFLYRTAASFIRARCGLEARPLLMREELALPDSGGGLIVVGSHVPRTTGQLERLLDTPGTRAIEVCASDLLSESRQPVEVQRVAQEASQGLRNGQDVVVFTSRKLVAGQDAEGSLAISRRISDGLVAIVSAITVRPRYILAKGGNTSSEIATRALAVRRALAPGQVLPGVPVWELGPESRHPGLKYIVFPGNVGGPQALAEVVSKLRP